MIPDATVLVEDWEWAAGGIDEDECDQLAPAVGLWHGLIALLPVVGLLLWAFA